MEGTEELGLVIPDFGEGGRGRQYVGYVLQGAVSSGAPIRIGDVGHDPVCHQYTGGISPSGGPPSEKETTMEVLGWEIKVTPSGFGYGGGRSGGGGYLCRPPPEHVITLH